MGVNSVHFFSCLQEVFACKQKLQTQDLVVVFFLKSLWKQQDLFFVGVN